MFGFDFQHNPCPSGGLAFVEEGLFVADGNHDTVQLMNLDTGSRCGGWTCTNPRRLAATGGRGLVAVLCSYREIGLFSLGKDGTGCRLRTFIQYHTGFFTDLRFGNDGHLVTFDIEGHIVRWDVENDKPKDIGQIQDWWNGVSTLAPWMDDDENVFVYCDSVYRCGLYDAASDQASRLPMERPNLVTAVPGAGVIFRVYNNYDGLEKPACMWMVPTQVTRALEFSGSLGQAWIAAVVTCLK
jgi:hypothetical protein